MLTGGRRKTALLGDAMEAVIAAVYLDGGLEAARALVLRHWGGRIAAARARWRATPRPRCRNGRRPAGCSRRSISTSTAAGPGPRAGLLRRGAARATGGERRRAAQRGVEARGAAGRRRRGVLLGWAEA